MVMGNFVRMPLYFSLIIVALSSSLALALLLPPLRQAGRGAALLHTTLLCAGGAATLVAMTFAMSQQLTEGAVALVAAWISVVPCLWLARAEPAYDEPDGYVEDDDDGGQPRPPWSPSPGSGGSGRLDLGRVSFTDARPVWPSALADGLPARAAAAQAFAAALVSARLPAVASVGSPSMPAAASAPAIQLYSGQFQPVKLGGHPAGPAGDELARHGYVPGPYSPVTPPPAAILEPGISAEPDRRLTVPSRPDRGDHRSIVHISAPVTHAGRRGEPASLPGRLMHRCQIWLWPAAPCAEDPAQPSHPAPAIRTRRANRRAIRLAARD